jgi:hypothetical protein
MKKVFKLVLSAAVVGVFAGCGGDGDGIDLGAPSVVACHAAPKTVKFKIKATNVPIGQAAANQSIVGPMTYNSQAVTGQTFIYLNSGAATNYWTITNDGVTDIAKVDDYFGFEQLNMALPPNMSPGETRTGTIRTGANTYTYSNTLVKFEEVTLAGKTFPNACHIKVENGRFGTTDDAWYAPGYGLIKSISSGGMTIQYDGDI